MTASAELATDLAARAVVEKSQLFLRLPLLVRRFPPSVFAEKNWSLTIFKKDLTEQSVRFFDIKVCQIVVNL